MVAISFDRHLYYPLLALEDKDAVPLKLRPLAFDAPSEVEFVRDLEAFYNSPDGKQAIGPTWKGLAGSKVTLDDGTQVVADDAYLRTAILQPKTQIVDGYGSVMPIYDGELTDAELDALIAYLHDLAPADAAGGSGS